jgi:uncharacterized cupredoxin-like copper-binding protein
MKRIVLMCLLALILLLGSACGTAVRAAPTVSATTQSSASAGSSTDVRVTLADNTIASSLTAFKVGVPYTFVIANTGRHEHNFNINEPTAVTGSLDASLSSALLTVDQNELPIGGSKTVQYTFTDAAIGKTLEFSCLIRRHYDDGMRLAITVTN